MTVRELIDRHPLTTRFTWLRLARAKPPDFPDVSGKDECRNWLSHQIARAGQIAERENFIRVTGGDNA